MRLLIVAILTLVSVPAFAFCNNHGGEIGECAATYGSLRPGHIVPPGEYHSAATFIIRNAGCISPNTRFGFHSSYSLQSVPNGYMYSPGDTKQMVPSPSGNEFQLEQFNQYPALQAELLARRAFQSLRLTFLSGFDVSRLTGIPLCRG